MNVTGGAIITRAFRLAGALGIAQSLGGDYEADGLTELRLLVQQMKLLPANAYAKTETVFQLTGNTPVTIGPAGDIDIPRPAQIERETFTRVSGVDHPLHIIDRASFARIRIKQVATTWPSVAWYEPASPVGELHFWPKSAAELHLVTIPALALFADVTTPHDLPDGYEGHLGALLAERLAPLYELTLSQEVRAQITESRRIIKRANIDVPQLVLGNHMISTRASFYGGE